MREAEADYKSSRAHLIDTCQTIESKRAQLLEEQLPLYVKARADFFRAALQVQEQELASFDARLQHRKEMLDREDEIKRGHEEDRRRIKEALVLRREAEAAAAQQALDEARAIADIAAVRRAQERKAAERKIGASSTELVEAEQVCVS